MIQYISKPFKYFFKLESASGLVLLFAAVIALFISNSSLGEKYFKILESYFTLGTKDFGLKLLATTSQQPLELGKSFVYYLNKRKLLLLLLQDRQ